MAWYDSLNPVNAADSVRDYLTDGSSETQDTTKTIPGRDDDANAIWSQFMAAFNGLSGNLSGKSSYLDDAFSRYSGAIGSANNEYQGTLSRLMSGLNNDNNKISFGLQGASPVSFTSKQDRENAELLSTMAQNILGSKSTLPTATYAEAEANNPYTSKLTLYNMLSDLANKMEDRRYGTATTSTTTSGTSSILDTLTALANVGASAAKAGSAAGAI